MEQTLPRPREQLKPPSNNQTLAGGDLWWREGRHKLVCQQSQLALWVHSLLLNYISLNSPEPSKSPLFHGSSCSDLPGSGWQWGGRREQRPCAAPLPSPLSWTAASAPRFPLTNYLLTSHLPRVQPVTGGRKQDLHLQHIDFIISTSQDSFC